jgi:hypothetical protein
MNQYIYVVVGSTSEYSDRQEWVVGAYRNEENAQRRVVELDNLMRLYGYDSIENNTLKYEELDQLLEAMRENPNGDSNFLIDYNGTRYYYYRIELKD